MEPLYFFCLLFNCCIVCSMKGYLSLSNKVAFGTMKWTECFTKVTQFSSNLPSSSGYFGQNVRRADRTSDSPGKGWRQSRSCETSDERFYGVGTRRKAEDSESVSWHAQLKHQQNLRRQMESDEQWREAAVLWGTVTTEQTAHGTVSWLPLSTKTKENLHRGRP